MIILKVTKNQGFTLSLEDTFFEKSQGWGGQLVYQQLALDLVTSNNIKLQIAENRFVKDYLQVNQSSRILR